MRNVEVTVLNEYDYKLAKFNLNLLESDAAILVKASTPKYDFVSDEEEDHFHNAYEIVQPQCDERLKSIAEKIQRETGVELTINDWSHIYLFAFAA